MPISWPCLLFGVSKFSGASFKSHSRFFMISAFVSFAWRFYSFCFSVKYCLMFMRKLCEVMLVSEQRKNIRGKEEFFGDTQKGLGLGIEDVVKIKLICFKKLLLLKLLNINSQNLITKASMWPSLPLAFKIICISNVFVPSHTIPKLPSTNKRLYKLNLNFVEWEYWSFMLSGLKVLLIFLRRLR